MPTAAPHRQCACGGGCPRCSGLEKAKPPHVERVTASAGAPPARGSLIDAPARATGSRVGDRPDRSSPIGDQVSVRLRSASPRWAGVLWRKCACGGAAKMSGECEECRTEATGLQRRRAGYAEPDGVPPIVHEALRSSGQPLDSATREFMEARFGHDFGQVLIHADQRASESARSVNAQAYTVGSDIVFGAGEYDPRSSAGQRLLAHELAHVVQQSGYGYAAPQVTRVSRADDVGEVQAEEAATRVVSMEGAEGLAPLSTPTVQRQPAPPAGKQPAKPALTRAEEVQLSITSPGEIAVTVNPPTTSFYNFAIDQPTLKKEHIAALQVIAKLIKGAGGKLRIVANGHADSSGEDTVNEPLSKNRVLTVQKAVGVAADVFWFGERRPMATNETVEGRSRNRRVDIFFSRKKDGDIDWPDLCALAPEICLCLKNPALCHKRDDDDDGIDWPSLCPYLPAWMCGVIVCIGLSVILENPTLCLPGLPILPRLVCLLFPSLCRHKPKPPEDPKKKARKACPVPGSMRIVSGIDKTTLEGGVVKTIDVNQGNLIYPFSMTVVFKQENPDKSPYCDCNCGEYRQYVSGYLRRNFVGVQRGAGPLKDWPHELAHGKLLHPTVMQEDGEPQVPGEKGVPYGHRYDDDRARLSPKDEARRYLKDNTDPTDQYLTDRDVPDRQDGCKYRGHDSVEISDTPLSEEVHIHLKFRAGPIDACNGNREVGEWKTWEIKADRVPKPPPPSPLPKGARGPGGGGPTFVPPRPSRSVPTGRGGSVVYRGGLPKDPKKGQTFALEIGFESQGKEYWTRIDVRIIAVSATEVTVLTLNSEPLNIAPEGDPEIRIIPHAIQPIPTG